MGTVLICLAAVNSFLNEWYSLVRTKFSIFVKQQSDAPEKVSVTISVDVVVVMLCSIPLTLCMPSLGIEPRLGEMKTASEVIHPFLLFTNIWFNFRLYFSQSPLHCSLRYRGTDLESSTAGGRVHRLDPRHRPRRCFCRRCRCRRRHRQAT